MQLHIPKWTVLCKIHKLLPVILNSSETSLTAKTLNLRHSNGEQVHTQPTPMKVRTRGSGFPVLLQMLHIFVSATILIFCALQTFYFL